MKYTNYYAEICQVVLNTDTVVDSRSDYRYTPRKVWFDGTRIFNIIDDRLMAQPRAYLNLTYYLRVVFGSRLVR